MTELCLENENIHSCIDNDVMNKFCDAGSL